MRRAGNGNPELAGVKTFVAEAVPADSPAMAKVATWIRECDEAAFQYFFNLQPHIEVLNARAWPVNVSEADGLLLSGGPDISAEFLKQPVADPNVIQDADAARDAWEFAALRSAIETGMPVLAICKGHQVLNVALGGTLHLDIPNHSNPESRSANIQPMRYGNGAAHRFPMVNSSHHQAIDQLGEGLEVEGWSASDDVIEQVRIRNYPFGLGVQYHPERDSLYANLFADFFQRI
jgi:putative glutamine amidotransferase